METSFCRPYGPTGLMHLLERNPGLASGAIFCSLRDLQLPEFAGTLSTGFIAR